MIGLEAIAANNGWAMALTGSLIVMSGLATLAFIISQLHRMIAIFEKKKLPEPTPAKPKEDIDVFTNVAAAARAYQSMTAGLGESFQLAQLYEFFEKENLPHPHLTISALREAGYLKPLGDGVFAWNQGDV